MLRLNLSSSKTLNRKLKVIDSDSKVKSFLNTQGCKKFLASLGLDSNELFLVKCLVAAGQHHVLHMGFGFRDGKESSVRSSVKTALYSLADMIEKWDFNNGGKQNYVKSRNGTVLVDEETQDLKKLLKVLGEIEDFYDCIGGIIGYQTMVLELLAQSSLEVQSTKHESMESQFLEIHPPTGCDLSNNTEYAYQAALWGIQVSTANTDS